MFDGFFLILQKHFPYAVIKFDIETATPLRDSSGFCIEADKGALDPGLYVGTTQDTEVRSSVFFFFRAYR